MRTIKIKKSKDISQEMNTTIYVYYIMYIYAAMSEHKN